MNLDKSDIGYQKSTQGSRASNVSENPEVNLTLRDQNV